MSKPIKFWSLTEVLDTIIDNRGKTVPTVEKGFPLIATNCIKHSSIYPTLENIRYVSEETLKNWFRAHLKSGDILFVNKGTPGRVCLVPDPVSFCAAQDMIAFRVDKNKIYGKYLFAILRSNFVQKKIENYHVGLVIPHFKKQDLNSIKIPKKPFPIQKFVGDIYFRLSEKVELNNKINYELESMAKLIYDYWFVQFDFPYDFKNNRPDPNGLPYKSSGGKMVYNEELKREIPAGWEIKQLSSLLKHNYKSISKTNSFKQIEYLDTSSLTKNRVEETQQINSETQKIPSRAQRIVCENDILYSTVRPNLCHYGIIKSPKNNMIASTGFVQLSSKNDKVSNDLLYKYLTSDWVTQRLAQIAALSVSSYPSISPNDILNLRIALPKEGKGLEFINSKLDNIYSMVSSNQKQNQKLSELRDWLLPMLMNGQVSVDDIKIDELTETAS